MDASFNHYSSSSSASSLSSPTSRPTNNNTHFTKPTRRKLNRRRRLCFILPLLLFLSGLVTFVGPMLYPTPTPAPGSVYMSHEIFQNLWQDILSDTFSDIKLSDVWRYKMQLKEQKRCVPPTSRQHLGTGTAGQYLIIEANGGLNQQRASICNAVAVAGLLNATLLIPRFDFHNVWRDSSEFGDIYDEEHFIDTLKEYVDVVRELPKDVMEDYDFNISNIPNFRVPAWASATYYLEEVYPVLREHRIIRFAPFANRLASSLPPHIQYLRCLANYEALRFSIPITTLGKALVKRMTIGSSGSGGKYVSVHLRFEEDMVAFSCCMYDGGKSEQLELDSIRQKGWGDKFKRKGYVIDPVRNRIDGRCPMTPLEVGMMLRGMGFLNTTPIYLASGKIYHADKNLAPLRKMFPLLRTKEFLASPNELASFQARNYLSYILKEHGLLLHHLHLPCVHHRQQVEISRHIICHEKHLHLKQLSQSMSSSNSIQSPSDSISEITQANAWAKICLRILILYERMKGYSSRLAALDYIVCLSSEVFVTTQGGNFPHFLMGHRKFHYRHAKTIIPDKRKLAVLLHNTTISWRIFKKEMQLMLEESDHKGIAIPKFKKLTRKNSIYANPFPECRCLQESNFSREE